MGNEMSPKPLTRNLPTSDGVGVVVTVTRSDDPAAWLLGPENTHHSTPTVFRENCYICRDPEFAQMGLPLCYACSACDGHVAADDTICDDCGEDAQDLYHRAQETICADEGHAWATNLGYWAKKIAVVDGKLTIKKGEWVEPWITCNRCGRGQGQDG